MVTPDRYPELLEKLLIPHTQQPYRYGDITTTLIGYLD